MAQKGFSAAVGAWVAEQKQRMVAVRNGSAQRVVAVMQRPVTEGGNLPFKTGFLRASLQAVKGDALPPLRDNPSDAGAFSWGQGELALVLTGASLSDTVTVAYTAKYAKRMEYGFTGQDSLGRSYRQQGRAFVRLAAQQWPTIVNQVAAEAQGRTQGRSAAAIYQGGGF